MQLVGDVPRSLPTPGMPTVQFRKLKKQVPRIVATAIAVLPPIVAWGPLGIPKWVAIAAWLPVIIPIAFFVIPALRRYESDHATAVSEDPTGGREVVP